MDPRPHMQAEEHIEKGGADDVNNQPNVEQFADALLKFERVLQLRCRSSHGHKFSRRLGGYGGFERPTREGLRFQLQCPPQRTELNLFVSDVFHHMAQEILAYTSADDH